MIEKDIEVKPIKKESKIGEYGYRWKPVDGYRTKDGKHIPPHLKIVKYKWKEN